MTMFALSDVELCAIGKAFDRAWDKFLRTGALTPKNFSDSRTILAARLLRAAYSGERDEWRLARDAVAYLMQITDAPGRSPGQPKPMQGAAHRRKIAVAKTPEIEQTDAYPPVLADAAAAASGAPPLP